MNLESVPRKYELLKLTGEALDDMSDERVVNLVTLIRCYHELFEVYPHRREYLEDVAYHTFFLAEIAASAGCEDVGKRLFNFVHDIAGPQLPLMPSDTSVSDQVAEIENAMRQLKDAYTRKSDGLIEDDISSPIGDRADR